jgi:hypothetical protein
MVDAGDWITASFYQHFIQINDVKIKIIVSTSYEMKPNVIFYLPASSIRSLYHHEYQV